MSRAHSDPYSNADAQKSWNLLEDAIAKIYEKKSFELSYEELYRHAYYLVLHRHGDLTFQNLQKSMRSHLKRYQHRLLQAQENEFLSQFNEIWIEAKEMVKGIAQIFLYMDRSYVVSKSLSPLKILGYQIFLQVFLEDQAFCNKFQQEVFDLIRQERDGLRIDRILLKNLLGMLIELGTKAHYTENMSSRPYGASALVGHYNHHNPAKNTCTLTITKDIYIKYFEKDFFKETEAYYHEEAQRNISNMTAIEYLNKAERRCKEELERVELYLDISTKKSLIDVFMSTYIVNHSKNISDMDGLYTLFDGEKLDEIKRLYKMFLFNEASTNLFLSAFLDYQKKNLEKIMSCFMEEETDYLTLVNNLVEFYRKITRISKSMYEKEQEKNIVISKIIKDAFEQHINSNSKIPFALNFFLDQQFKEGFKGLKDSEIEAILNDVIALFKFINDKDVFEKTYKTFLSKRLLTGRSVSEEHERLLIEKLQQECGSYFTAKIEVMFKDISLSKMIMSEFHSKCHTMPFAYQNAGIENLEAIKAFEVQVLTTGNWPFQDNDQCNLPAELKMWTKLFEGFYINKYPGRGLKWMLSQGTAEVKGHFNGKKKEFIMTTYQMCILLLFNAKKTIKVDEIVSQTMIPEEEVYNNIAAFISLKLMSKNSEGLEVKGDDAVTLNEDFTHKNYRIKVPSKKKKEKNQDGEKKVLENITIERKYSVEASIVRIMKSRKRLEHGNLVEEVMKLSTLHQFKPDAALIKKVIEELITKEYIDRAPENRNMYIYLS